MENKKDIGMGFIYYINLLRKLYRLYNFFIQDIILFFFNNVISHAIYAKNTLQVLNMGKGEGN